jgi:hypothetical protein
MRPEPARRTGKRSLIGAALAAGATLLAAGCTTGLFARKPTPQPAPVINRSAASSEALAQDFALLHKLLAADPVSQQEIVDQADKAYDQAPTPSRKLRLALILGTPGHPGANLPFAKQLFEELLSDPHPQLLPGERTLAELEVQLIGDHLTLESENRTLQGQADRASSLALENRRLAAAADENVNLRRALEEARAKLAAIANIEKSLNERKPEGRPK